MMDINLVGQQIQGYTITRKLGSGGYGTVYLGIKEELGKQYQTAVKYISIPDAEGYETVLQDYGYDKSATQEYFEEIASKITSEINMLMELSKRDNRYIVAYYDHEIQRHTEPLRYEIFMRMEYLTPLSRHIRQNGMTVGDVIRLGINMCDALSLCHDNGIMHRDIKEANIFISENGNFKLGDFGVAKSAIETSQTGSIKGTASYMAPEIYQREPYDKSVDIYSLGIVLYKLLNHQRLPFMPDAPAQFTADDKIMAETRRLKGEIPPLPANAESKLGEIIVKACSAKEERYKKAEDFRDCLQAMMQSLSEEECNRTAVPQTADNAADSDEGSLYDTYTQTQGATMTMGMQGTDAVMGNQSASGVEAVQNPYAKKQKKKKGKAVAAIAIAIPLIVILTAGYLFISKKLDPLNRFQAAIEEDNYEEAEQLYNDKLKSGDSDILAKAEYVVADHAEEIKKRYYQGNIEYEDALNQLQNLEKFATTDKDSLQTVVEEINKLYLSRTSYEKALSCMDSGDYESAVNDLRKVIQEDSNYADAQIKIADAIKRYKEGLLASLVEFEPDKQYDEAILALQAGLLVVPEDADFLAKIADYEKKIADNIQLMISSIIRDVKNDVSVSGDYVGALKELREAEKQYSNSEEIKMAVMEIEEEYLGVVLTEAETIAGESGYVEAVEALKEALLVLPNNASIKTAISEYEAKYPILLQQMVYFTGEALENGGQEKDNMQEMQINIIQTDSRGLFDNTYKLEEQYVKITGVLYQPFDERSDRYERVLEIFGDGRLLYSTSMRGGKEPVSFEVDLGGVYNLEIKFVNEWGSTNTYHSGYARLANVELFQ